MAIGQMVKVVIVINRLVIEHAQKRWNTEVESQVLKHKCWNTSAETQVLEHKCWNIEAGAQMMTQTVTVVIDGNRLVMEHAQQKLEHKC
jgi:hypothetical protein